jgi:predicted DNA-binding protein YlxM (UPF0122 family)
MGGKIVGPDGHPGEFEDGAEHAAHKFRAIEQVQGDGGIADVRGGGAPVGIVLFGDEEDLSLAEIAADVGITRQGVRDSVKKAEAILTEAEEKLGLARRFKELSEKMDIIKEKLVALSDEKLGPVIDMIDKIEI